MTKSFTLVETLIAIFIFFVIMVGLSSSVVWLYRTHSYTWQQALAVDEARRGIETMVKEIREAKQADFAELKNPLILSPAINLLILSL